MKCALSDLHAFCMLIRWQLFQILPKPLSDRLADAGESLHLFELFIGPVSAWFTTLFALQHLGGWLDLMAGDRIKTHAFPWGSAWVCHVVKPFWSLWTQKIVRQSLNEISIPLYHSDSNMWFVRKFFALLMFRWTLTICLAVGDIVSYSANQIRIPSN